MKLLLHDLLVLTDTAYGIMGVNGHHTLGCKYSKEAIKESMNRIQHIIASVELDVDIIEEEEKKGEKSEE